VVGGGGCKPIIVLSFDFGQAEQLFSEVMLSSKFPLDYHLPDLKCCPPADCWMHFTARPGCACGGSHSEPGTGKSGEC
jgi:hypothetical protein